MIAWGQSIDEVARAHHVPLELAGLWLAVLADRLGLAAEGSRRADDELVCEIGQNLFFDHEAPDVLTRLRAGGDVRVWAEAVRVTGDADGVARALGVPVGELLDAVAPHLAGAAWEFWLEETRRTHVVPVPPAVQVIEPPVDHAELTIPLHIDVDMLELLHTEPDLPDDETMFPRWSKPVRMRRAIPMCLPVSMAWRRTPARTTDFTSCSTSRRSGCTRDSIRTTST